MTGMSRALRRMLCCSATAAVVLAGSIGYVHAEPADDALAKLNELSQQALDTREAVTDAQYEVEAKVAEQTAAEDRHRADAEALAVANSQLEPYQAAANRVAAMTYMSGRTGQIAAALTAASPQQLVDRLALQEVVDAQTAAQLKAFRSAQQQAASAAAASEKSAAEARAKAEQAVTVQADLQAKWQDLLRQIRAAEAQYGTLTPQQQEVINSAAVVAPSPAAHVEIPEALPVGVANEVGLQANTIVAARAVSAQFPQISTIDGVRPDSKPWHPNGLAIDIMIPNYNTPEGIALGDQIVAFALANAGRFGLQDVIWRNVYYTPSGPQATGYGHYDHVHITTMPRR
ncbi:coiled-coil domain-containing protein [Mycolicibacterium thermoresistibile]